MYTTQVAPATLLGPRTERPDPGTLPSGTTYRTTDTSEGFVVARDVSGARWNAATSPPVDVAVYVDPVAGKDVNPGTQALPVATLRRAIDLWGVYTGGVYIKTCRIFVGPGTTAETQGDIIFTPPRPVGTGAEPPIIIGTMTDVGLGTMTVQSFSPDVVPSATSAGDGVVPTAGSFAFDVYAGLEFFLTSGTLVNRAYTIMNNTTTTVYLPHNSHFGTPAPGDHFQIRKPASIIGLNGTIEIVGTECAMYGLTFSQVAGSTDPTMFLVSGATVYPDSVVLNIQIRTSVEGSINPGQAHNLCTIPGGPAKSFATLGMFVNNVIFAHGGNIGDFRHIDSDTDPLAPDTTASGVLVMRNGVLFMESGRVDLYVADLPRVFLFGMVYFTVIEHWRINGSPAAGFSAQGNCFVQVAQVDISNCVGDGISLDMGSVLTGFVIRGGSNGGVGMRTAHGAKASMTDISVFNGTNITGTGGDVTVGSNTSGDTWANIATGQAAHTTDWNASSSGAATSQGCRIGP